MTRTKKRAGVDTNVFVSRLLRFESVSGRAAEKAIHHATVLVSESTINELTEVLAQAKFDRTSPSNSACNSFG